MITHGRVKTTLLLSLFSGMLAYAGWIIFLPGKTTSNIAYVEGQYNTLYSAVDAHVITTVAAPGQTVKREVPLITFDLREWHAAFDQLNTSLAQAQLHLQNLQQQAPILSAITQAQLSRHQHYTNALSLAQEAHQRQLKMGDLVSLTDKDQSALQVVDRQAVWHESRHAYHQAQHDAQNNVSEQKIAINRIKDLELALKHHLERKQDYIIKSNTEAYIHAVSVSPGGKVQKGQAVLSYVPKQAFWVTAYFKETELINLPVGTQVTVHLDAYPKTPLKGKISTLSHLAGSALSPQSPNYSAGNFTRIVQRIPVRIDFDTESLLAVPHLAIGLSATVTLATP